MIVVLLNRTSSVGKTTLALHLAGHWARQRKRVTLIDADPQRRRRARDRRVRRRDRKTRAMAARGWNGGFASRPHHAESRVNTLDRAAGATPAGDLYTARLTIDITPALRGRIKIAAFQRGEAVADMLRALLTREFPDIDGGNS